LIPGSIINPHHGWTDDFLRIHLGLICDPECKITVGDETKTWEEGKILAFKDGGPFLHSVEHKGTTERIILSVDVKLSYLSQYVNNINIC
jgi:aspartyl/asparaginyl beta-hydroxylase (cupin superfamily)